MREGIFLFFIISVMLIVFILAGFVALAIVVFNTDLSLWLRIPAFIIDILIGVLVGMFINEMSEPL